MRWIAFLTAVFILLGVERVGAVMGEENDLWAADADLQNIAKLVAARALIQAEQYSRAIVLLKAVVRAEPENAHGWNLLAYSFRMTGDFDRALEGYTKALEVDRRHLLATEYLGELYLQIHDLEGALRQMEALSALCPDGCLERTDLAQEIEAYRKRLGGAGG